MDGLGAWMLSGAALRPQVTPSLAALICVPLAALFVLWAASQVARGVRYKRRPAPSSGSDTATAATTTVVPPRPRREHKTEYDAFTPAQSLFDTGGGLLTSWSDALGAAQQGAVSNQGWFNLAFLVLCFHVATNLYSFRRMGAWMADQGAWVLTSVWHAPEFFRDCAVLCLFYACASFGFQLWFTFGRSRAARWRPLQYAVQATCEAATFVGCLWHVRSRPEWPLLQRLAFLMQVRAAVRQGSLGGVLCACLQQRQRGSLS
jgi:hypothetical protein